MKAGGGQILVYFNKTLLFNFLFVFLSFDFLHKKQSGGAGQYGKVIGTIEVSRNEAVTNVCV